MVWTLPNALKLIINQIKFLNKICEIKGSHQSNFMGLQTKLTLEICHKVESSDGKTKQSLFAIFFSKEKMQCLLKNDKCL